MRVLILTSRFPYPLEKGDKLRLFHQIKYLSYSHELVLVSLEAPSSKRDRQVMEQYCDRIYSLNQHGIRHWYQALAGLLEGKPLHVGYFLNQKFVPRITEIIKETTPDHIFCQLIRMAPYLSQIKIPSSIDYMDAFSLRMERRAGQIKWLRWFWNMEARRLRKFEWEIYPDFQHRFIISESDRAYLHSYGLEELILLKNGVDTHYFNQKTENNQKAYDLAFVGNMGYFPNIQAAKYLVQRIAKRIKQKKPNLKVLIAGASPTRSIRALANDWITVTGYMDDIRDAYQSSKIFVAPIFTGSGLQNKILEAMAMELPCITTSVVQKSIQAPDNLIRIADDPHEFEAHINQFLADENLMHRVGIASRKFVQEQFSWETCCKPLDQLSSLEAVLDYGKDPH